MEQLAPTLSARYASWFAPVLVWGLWAFLFLAALIHVGRNGRNIPVLDEWAFVPYLTGDEEVTLGWLWSQHSDHRIPLLRFIYLGVGAASGCDLRAGMLLNAAALGALAFAMIRTARHVRGHTVLADAFFPLAFLHLGLVSTLCLGSVEFAYILPALLVSSLLLLMVRNRRPNRVVGLLAGGCVVLLPLVSAAGSAFALPLGLWVAVWALWSGPTPDSCTRPWRLFILTLAILGLVLIPVSFLGNEVPWWRTEQPDDERQLGAVLVTASQVLSMALGEGIGDGWRYAAGFVVALFAASLGVLVLGFWRNQRPERIRALGLFFFLGGGFALALGMGWGRTGAVLKFGSYGVLTVPLLCAAYFLWEIYGPVWFSRTVQAVLCILLAALLVPNTDRGWIITHNFLLDKDTPEQSLQDGVSVSRFIKRHATTLLEGGYPGQVVSNDYLEECLHALRREGVGYFGNLADEPRFHEVLLPLTPAAIHEGTWRNGVFTGTGAAAHLTFALEKPSFVYGLRIHYTHTNEKNGPAYLKIIWRKAREGEEFNEVTDFNSEARTVDERLLQTGGGHSVTIWTRDTLGAIRLYPDMLGTPYTFRITKIVLLLPADGAK